MSTSFATVDELENTMKRTFTGGDLDQAEATLDAASEAIRDAAGAWIAPTRTSTVALPVDDRGRITLPQHPVVSVGEVTGPGGPVPFDFDGIVITVDPGHARTRLDVTFDYGAATVPSYVRNLALALAASAIMMTELGIGTGPGPVSTIAIDDFRASFTNAEAGAGIVIPTIQADALRDRYGPPAMQMVETGP